MKYSLLSLILVLFISITATAQVGKGYKFLGGSVNFNYDQEGTFSTTYYSSGYTYYNNGKLLTLDLSPDFGFFIGDHWAMAISPGYRRISGTETSNFYSTVTGVPNQVVVNDYHSDFVSLALQFRYYWMITDEFGIYPQFGIGTSHDTKDFGSGLFAVGGGPNVVYFPTEKLGINMGFGNLNYSFSYANKASAINLGLNSSISFGVTYYYGGK